MLTSQTRNAARPGPRERPAARLGGVKPITYVKCHDTDELLTSTLPREDEHGRKREPLFSVANLCFLSYHARPERDSQSAIMPGLAPVAVAPQCTSRTCADS
jgi:hypothetical protein